MLFSSRKSFLALAVFVLAAIAFEPGRREDTASNGVETSTSITSSFQIPPPSTSSPTTTSSTSPESSSSSRSTPTPVSTTASTTESSTTTSITSTSTSSSDEPSSTSSESSSSTSSESSISTDPSKTTTGEATTTESPTPSKFTSPLVTSHTTKVTTTIVSTNGHSTFSTVVTSDKVVASTTGFVTGTTSPQLNDDTDDEDGGLSASQIKIIGGVIGGVGGAIVIGIILFVVWRLKNQDRDPEVRQELMSGHGKRLSSRPVSDVNTSPFQSTLDQYHNPGGRANASANF